jgi:hypothetical protein
MGLARRGYDPELQMYIEYPREPDLARLRFLRWLGEQGLLEHSTAGTPSGEFALQIEEKPALAA